MTFTNRSLIAGAFTDEALAQQAVADLQQADFSDDQIRYSVHKGGAGILDSLMDVGLGQEEARYYNREFLNGRTIVTVKTTDRQQEAADILQRHGASDASRQMSQTSGTMSTNRPFQTGAVPEEEQKLQLKEEQLLVTKERVQAGEVDLHKEIVTEQQTITVPVSHEEIVIERHAVSGNVPVENASFAEQGETIRVPLSEEQVNVSKQTVVREEIDLGKRVVQENQQVTDTVRHEEARIERDGNVQIEGEEDLDDLKTRRRGNR